jgi:hypothetical protein
MAATNRINELKKDFASAELGDARRSARLVRVVQAIAEEPGIGFPRALGSTAELEAFYRFLNNDAFDASAVFEPHRLATLTRAADAQEDVIFIHDTTTVEYRGEGTREGLGYTTALGRQGFMAHVSLCLGARSGLPLGVGYIETYTRTGKIWAQRKRSRSKRQSKEERESARWLRGVEVTQTAALRQRAIHIMDAEADFFELFRRLADDASRFVIRAGQLERLVHEDGELLHLREVLEGLEPIVYRDVSLSERRLNVKTAGSNGRKKNPPRSERVARVAIAATTISLGRTRYTKATGANFEVNVVFVWEPNPPKNQPPVSWVLFTSEPVKSKKDLERVVDLYRKRWTIEDYFKALKTGCALERRQIESYEALCKVLAILAPIACQLLWLRGMHRIHPTAPARAVFTKIELEVLARSPATQGMPKPKTVADAILLLARLGGHLKNNGAPGWMTLGRGYEKLLLLHIGWQMALQALGRCDQS